MMKIVTGFQWSIRLPAVPNLSGTMPRPFLEISAQNQLRTKWAKKNSVMKVVNMRGELRTPFVRPPILWTALTILGWYAKEERT